MSSSRGRTTVRRRRCRHALAARPPDDEVAHRSARRRAARDQHGAVEPGRAHRPHPQDWGDRRPEHAETPEGWTVRVGNNASVTTSFDAYAVCVLLA
ncbi:MAG: hypothetical protein H0T91_09940 [Propionibacteriaceae bacterium]|nr:hypothetical protein [Propionibacteriaceae bacterium]